MIRWFRWELAFAWCIVVLYFLVGMLVAVFECKPVAYFWDKSIHGGTCINQDQFFRWDGVANLLIDFMILTLTMPLIWRLRLQTRQKLSLTVVFLLGLLYVFHTSPNPFIQVKLSLADQKYTKQRLRGIHRAINYLQRCDFHRCHVHECRGLDVEHNRAIYRHYMCVPHNLSATT